jgi:hypothetical protein
MVAAETKHHGSYDILRLVLGLGIATVLLLTLQIFFWLISLTTVQYLRPV